MSSLRCGLIIWVLTPKWFELSRNVWYGMIDILRNFEEPDSLTYGLFKMLYANYCLATCVWRVRRLWSTNLIIKPLAVMQHLHNCIRTGITMQAKVCLSFESIKTNNTNGRSWFLYLFKYPTLPALLHVYKRPSKTTTSESTNAINIWQHLTLLL